MADQHNIEKKLPNESVRSTYKDWENTYHSNKVPISGAGLTGNTSLTVSDLLNGNAKGTVENNYLDPIPFVNKLKQQYTKLVNSVNGKRGEASARTDSLKMNRKNMDYTNEGGTSCLNLLMPQYARRVEVEDLDENFWVIGQVLDAIVNSIWGDDGLLSIINFILKQIEALWQCIGDIYNIIDIIYEILGMNVSDINILHDGSEDLVFDQYSRFTLYNTQIKLSSNTGERIIKNFIKPFDYDRFNLSEKNFISNNNFLVSSFTNTSDWEYFLELNRFIQEKKLTYVYDGSLVRSRKNNGDIVLLNSITKAITDKRNSVMLKDSGKNSYDIRTVQFLTKMLENTKNGIPPTTFENDRLREIYEDLSKEITDTGGTIADILFTVNEKETVFNPAKEKNQNIYNTKLSEDIAKIISSNSKLFSYPFIKEYLTPVYDLNNDNKVDIRDATFITKNNQTDSEGYVLSPLAENIYDYISKFIVEDNDPTKYIESSNYINGQIDSFLNAINQTEELKKRVKEDESKNQVYIDHFFRLLRERYFPEEGQKSLTIYQINDTSGAQNVINSMLNNIVTDHSTIVNIEQIVTDSTFTIPNNTILFLYDNKRFNLTCNSNSYTLKSTTKDHTLTINQTDSILPVFIGRKDLYNGEIIEIIVGKNNSKGVSLNSNNKFNRETFLGLCNHFSDKEYLLRYNQRTALFFDKSDYYIANNSTEYSYAGGYNKNQIPISYFNLDNCLKNEDNGISKIEHLNVQMFASKDKELNSNSFIINQVEQNSNEEYTKLDSTMIYDSARKNNLILYSSPCLKLNGVYVHNTTQILQSKSNRTSENIMSNSNGQTAVSTFITNSNTTIKDTINTLATNSTTFKTPHMYFLIGGRELNHYIQPIKMTGLLIKPATGRQPELPDKLTVYGSEEGYIDKNEKIKFTEIGEITIYTDENPPKAGYNYRKISSFDNKYYNTFLIDFYYSDIEKKPTRPLIGEVYFYGETGTI